MDMSTTSLLRRGQSNAVVFTSRGLDTVGDGVDIKRHRVCPVQVRPSEVEKSA